MISSRGYRALRLSSVLTLIGLALCAWSLFDPAPLPVIFAMTAAQGIGTLAFLIYLAVIASELRRAGIFGRRRKKP